jgi:hypothetical protein
MFIRLSLLCLASVALRAQPTRHPFNLDDMAKIRDVRDPQCSPDGLSVAYAVATVDVKADKTNSHIRMIGFDGKNDRQVTSSLTWPPRNLSPTRPSPRTGMRNRNNPRVLPLPLVRFTAIPNSRRPHSILQTILPKNRAPLSEKPQLCELKPLKSAIPGRCAHREATFASG